MSIRNLLQEEIQDEFENLGKMELGSETYKTTVDGLTKLVDRAIELDKFAVESDDKDVCRDIDTELKTQQMESEKKDRLVKNGIAIAGIIIPVVVTVWGTILSFKFEEEGTITTILGRGFINKLLPKK